MKEYKAGIYLRLSKEDDNPNNSISAQRDIILNYARKNNFNVVKEYIDNGWSGILDSRPALNEMIFDILKSKIDMLIVKDLSRLTRDKNKTGYYAKLYDNYAGRCTAQRIFKENYSQEIETQPFKVVYYQL